MTVYYAGAGVVPKEKHTQIKVSLPIIVMCVDSIYAFAWTHYYEALRYFSIRIRFEGHLRRMDAIMCSIMSRKNPQKHECRVSLSTT